MITLSTLHALGILPSTSDTEPHNNPQDEGTIVTIFQMGK